MGLKGIVKNILNNMGFEIRRISRKTELPDLRTQLSDFVVQELRTIEASLDDSATRADAFTKLRDLSLCDFGMLLITIPNPDFPRLSALLPRMAKEEVQLSWTGSAGVDLLKMTVDFVRSLSYNFPRLTGRPLEGAKVLDFGCGYGRITRLMYYFSNEDLVYGLDPWDKSIEICHADGLTKNFLQSDYLPATLPVPRADFDLIFAFSVFTHLSERATVTCLNTLADYVKPDGLIAITV